MLDIRPAGLLKMEQSETPPSMHYVYVLKRKNMEWYIGSTDDLRRRYAEHKKAYPCELIYYEAYIQRKIAKDREHKLKYYGSAWRSLKQRFSA